MVLVCLIVIDVCLSLFVTRASVEVFQMTAAAVLPVTSLLQSVQTAENMHEPSTDIKLHRVHRH